METNVWINITFNADNRIEGKDEFLGALKQEGVIVQEREKWIPAFGTGLEIPSFYVLVNSTIVKTIVGMLAGGMLYDMVEKYIPHLFTSLHKLQSQNKELTIGCLDFEFNDITIKLKDLRNVDYISLLNAFVDMPNHIEYLNQNGISAIKEISLPYELNVNYSEDDTRKYIAPDEFTDNTEYLWRIEYYKGCEHCYYNPRTHAITID